MKFIIVFLFATTLVFSQKDSSKMNFEDVHKKLQEVNEKLKNKVEELKQRVQNTPDSMYLPFMNDSIKVERWYANGLMELTLIEIEIHGYSYIKYLQKTKFLQLPDEILLQIYKIIKKNKL